MLADITPLGQRSRPWHAIPTQFRAFYHSRRYTWRKSYFLNPVYRPPRCLHLDEKANVLIDADGHAVLADYGLVFIIDSSDFDTTKILGACRWTAPELMRCDEEEDSDPPFSLATDIFAFAMTTIEVCLAV